MDLLDKVILEWSIKTGKGYPDIDNEEDIALLESMLGFNLFEQTYRTLTWTQLKKKTGATPRVNTLYNLIEKSEPIELVTGEKVVLKFKEPEYGEYFKNGDLDKIKEIGGRLINKFPFFKEKGNPHNVFSFFDLAKTPTFGGKGSGPEHSGLRYEQIAIGQLNDFISTLGEPIDIKLNDTLYENITEVLDIKGTPTADFAFASNKKPLIFISHKNGTTPKDFQQYSGFKYFIDKYKEVRDFVQAVAESEYYIDNSLERRTLLTRKIVSDDLKREAVYGFNSGNYGPNNCQLLIQGDIWLEKEDNHYEIKGTKLISNPDIPQGEYEPVMVVSYRSNMSSMGLTNARFGIYSRDRYPNAVEI